MSGTRSKGMKNIWVRLLLTVLCAALIWWAFGFAAHWVPSVKLRTLAVIFLAVTFIWRVWPDAARAFGNLQARLLLTLLYGIVVLPIGLLALLLADPLRIKKRPTEWIDHPEEPNDLAWARRQ